MTPPKPVRTLPRPLSAIRTALANDAAGGIVLMVAAAAALAVANSPLAGGYHAALHLYLGPLSLLHWINDGLMVVFFLLVGLEIKREALDGRLRTWPDRVLPGLAAAAGMVAPALVYLALNAGSGTARAGRSRRRPTLPSPSACSPCWGRGCRSRSRSSCRRSPSSTISARWSSSHCSIPAASISGCWPPPSACSDCSSPSTASACGRSSLSRPRPRPVVPGPALGRPRHGGGRAARPVRADPPEPGPAEDATSPLHRLEHALSPWVAFLIVPVFGFANAGVTLVGLPLGALLDPVTLGVGLGLFLGKQAGIFAAVRLAVASGLAARPRGASWGQVYGVSLLCGIGFTMSLFIGGLAFTDGLHETETKLGVLGGSLLSGIFGAVVLAGARRRARGG